MFFYKKAFSCATTECSGGLFSYLECLAKVIEVINRCIGDVTIIISVFFYLEYSEPIYQQSGHTIC